MKSGNYIPLLLCFLSLAGCRGNNKTKPFLDTDSSTYSVSAIRTGMDVEPGLKDVDSLQVLYYDNPDGDSLRYTRFYKYVNVTDSSFINALKYGLEQPFNKKGAMTRCRSEGKIYLYRKKEVVKTVYFSTRCEQCCHLFFISNGSFMYFELNGTLSAQLKTLKEKAVMP